MRIYVLDTDICGFVQSNHLAVMRHINALPEGDEVVTTIITFGEDLSGWLPSCRRAKNHAERIKAYARLQRGLEFYKSKDCLPLDDIASSIFDRLRARKIHIGANDLAIAAITLSINGILVTRNIVDFQRIPDLTIEDWTK